MLLLALLQLLSKTFAYTTGHTLPSSAYAYGQKGINLLTSEQVLRFLETKNRTHSSGSFNVWKLIANDKSTEKVEDKVVQARIEELKELIKKGDKKG